MKANLILTTSLLCAAPLAMAQIAKPMQLNVDPPLAVGQQFDESLQTSHRFSMTTVGGDGKKRAKDSKSESDVTFRREILALDSKGSVTAVALTINSCDAQHYGQTIQGLTPGTRIEGRRSGADIIFTVDGKPAQPTLHRLLRELTVLWRDPRQYGDGNLVLNTKTARSPGEKWPLAAADFIAGAPGNGLSYRPEGFTGDISFKETTITRGIPSVRLDYGLTIAVSGMAENYQPDPAQSTMKVTTTEYYAQQGTCPCLLADSQIKLDIKGTVPTEPGTTFAYTATTKEKRASTPVRK